MPDTSACSLPIRLVPMDEYLTPDARLSLPTQLLPASDALGDLLSACGVPAAEAAWDGAASAYDRFAALLSVLPLMPGHPLPCRLTALVRALGCGLPLDAENASAVWAALSDVMGPAAAEPLTIGRLAARMGVPLLTVLRPDRAVLGTRLPDSPDARSAWIADALAASDAPVLFRLPDGYSFTRPNPYRAGMLTQIAVSSGGFAWGELPSAERDHLLTQFIRETGAACRRDGRCMTIAGREEQLNPLLAYLSDTGCLPPTRRLLMHPEDGDIPLPAFSGVTDGLWLEGTDTPLSVRRAVTAYAERMPILCADAAFVSLRTPTDLCQPAAITAVYAELMRSWCGDNH